MPISCRRVVNIIWRHWLQVSVQARHDEQCVYVYVAGLGNILHVLCPWRLVEALTIFHCLRRPLAALVCARCGRAGELNFRLPYPDSAVTRPQASISAATTCYTTTDRPTD